MDQPLISARDVHLAFPALTPRERQLKSNPIRMLSDFYLSRPTRKIAHILNGLTLDVRPGDRLALIGQNGSGKSTFLRMLAGVFTPTSGTLEIRGRTTGLFDVMSGMSMDATGLENIYLRGLQMGMTLSEIRLRISDVMRFTELGDDINKVIETYSSGMRLRLAFAVSTMIDTDILLLDEWLGAGDARFRDRVSERMESLVEQSRALVLASHSLPLLRQFCNKGLVLEDGRQVFYGDLDEAIRQYHWSIAQAKTDEGATDTPSQEQPA